MRRPLSAIALTALLAFTAAACDDDETPTTPSETSPVLTTETFTGTLQRNGGFTFTFTNTAAGNVLATLNSVDPDTTAPLGLALGTWNGTACQIILANDSALEGATIDGATTNAAALCMRIYDSKGELPGPIAFTISVRHP